MVLSHIFVTLMSSMMMQRSPDTIFVPRFLQNLVISTVIRSNEISHFNLK